MRAGLALVAALLPAAGAIGQTVAEERRAYVAARAAAAAAEARADRLAAGAGAAAGRAAAARAAITAMAARVTAAEAATQAAAQRLALARRLHAAERAELGRRRRPLVQLMAALAAFARRPPAAALVQPGSLRDAVHTRAMLAAAAPVIAARTQALAAAVAQAERRRRAMAAAADALAAQQRRLLARRAALARLEAGSAAAAVGLGAAAGQARYRALGLAERARDIEALIGALAARAATGRRLAALPGPLLRPDPPRPAPPPLLARADAAPLAYRLPVAGRLAIGRGELTEGGAPTRGLTFSTAPRARVVAPATGHVAFAGAFGGYGRVVILDHGRGWTSALTGLAETRVAAGAAVAAGDPIGRAGPGRPTVTVELRRGEIPADIVALVSHR
ncbi:MAG: peptidoglycan DD-metalloendopeptidase family protein [Sphingomonas fennica]